MDQVYRGEGVAVEFVSRVQLRAILSGLAIVAGVFAVCIGLSWAIGLSTFQPTVGHARGLALGNIIWGAIALWISLFFGAYIAALVGRSTDGRSGVLHGLVVWGSTAAIIGFLIVLLFSGLLMALLRMSGSDITVGNTAPSVATRAVGGVAQAAGLTVWLYWAGIVGGLFTSLLGGFLGARNESRVPARAPRTTTVTPGVPQPV